VAPSTPPAEKPVEASLDAAPAQDAPPPWTTSAELPDAAPVALPARPAAEVDAIAIATDVLRRYDAGEDAIAGTPPPGDPIAMQLLLQTDRRVPRGRELTGGERWDARGLRFVLTSEADLQAAADAMGDEADFLAIWVDLNGRTARVWAGFDFLLPENSKFTKMCCCMHVDRYERQRDETWHFVQRRGTACS
jgi:hypothetical protein